MASETPFTDMLRDLSSTMRLGTDHAAAAMGVAAARIDARDRDVAELVAALGWLLADTQHADHECGDMDCPVDAARAVYAKHKGGA